MTPKNFSEFLAEIQRQEAMVLDSKAHEYAPGEDRFHNFVRAAALLGQTPAEACWSFCAKHLISIGDIVAEPQGVTPAVLREKIGDARNYLALLEAILVEDITRQLIPKGQAES